MRKLKTYIISEHTQASQYTVLNENTSTGSIIIEAVLQTADAFNRNGRKYPVDVLKKAIDAPHIKELIARKSWVGEAGHPMGADTARQVTIDTDRISHRILSVRWEGNNLIGVVESLNTKNGNDFKNLILQGMEVAFSLRALGAADNTPQGAIVRDPMRMVCYDWVILPSHKEAYQTKIMNGLSESCGMDMATVNSIIAESMSGVFREFVNPKLKDKMCMKEGVVAFLESVQNTSGQFRLNESMTGIIVEGEHGNRVYSTKAVTSRSVNKALLKLTKF
ncbi:MAG: S80 family phage morphogenetic serine protease [Fusobacteriaceae bacterium]